jgi:hypothetical protein
MLFPSVAKSAVSNGPKVRRKDGRVNQRCEWNGESDEEKRKEKQVPGENSMMFPGKTRLIY